MSITKTKTPTKGAKTVTPLVAQNGAKTVKSSSKSLKTEEEQKISKTTVDEILKPKVENLKISTAEQRISKLKVFQEITQKYEDLKDKKEEFDIYRASFDNTGQKISLTNSSKQSFIVGNTQTHQKVMEVIAADLDVFLGKAKEEVESFTI